MAEFADSRSTGQVHGERVVTIGGGTGPFALLSTLKRHACAPTAVVTMADSGGSSRRLMDEFGQLPLGDLRQALVALSRKGTLWRHVFAYRFPDGPGAATSFGVGGHSLGNLVLSALQSMNDGNLLHAILDAQELLDTAGNVLPVTLSPATLCAELTDGTTLTGESEIDTRGQRDAGPLLPIRRVFLREHVQACPDTVRAIRRADVIVIGPGDLYTSILPNLLVAGIAEAVAMSEAHKVYVCNLMTKHGETDGFRASDFVREVTDYLGHALDRVVIHDGSIPRVLLERYAAEEQHAVEPDVDAVRRLVPDVVSSQFVTSPRDHLIRHDPDRLIRAIFAPWNYAQPPGDILTAGRTLADGSALVPPAETSLAWRVDDVD